MRYASREQEFEYIDGLFAKTLEKDLSRFTVIFGRRGTGKTSLVWRVAKNHPELPFIYLCPFRTSARDLARRWGKDAARALGYPYEPAFEKPGDVLRFLFAESEKKPLAVFVDECQDITEISPTFWGEMQYGWDFAKDKSRILLIMGGSVEPAIRKIFEDYDEPFYQRHNGLLQLRPFRPTVLESLLREANPGAKPEDLLLLYAITGGVPGYVEKLLDAGAADFSSMVEAFFRDGSFFMTEALLMLADELRVDSPYYALLMRLMAEGVTKREELQKRLPEVQAGGYLDRLQWLYGLVKRVDPVVYMGYRKARYDLVDPYLAFWHAFAAARLDLVSSHQWEEVKRYFRERWPDYAVRAQIRWFRAKIWESCLYPKLGPWWDRSGKTEIDLVAADEKRRIAWVFEMERPGRPSEEWAVRQKAARMLEACRTLHGFDVRTKCLTMDDVMRPVEEFAPPERN